jgi:ABC-2 type transport system permease protein
MRVITAVDPFTYAVHGFKQLILKNGSLISIGGDLAYLALFTLISITAATLLFRRTL